VTGGWTVWWWPTTFDASTDVPVPLARTYDSLGDAVAAAASGVRAGAVSWVKVFKTGDESDVRARWDASEGDEWTNVSREAERVLALICP
jgi:hypothetical protein